MVVIILLRMNITNASLFRLLQLVTTDILINHSGIDCLGVPNALIYAFNAVFVLLKVSEVSKVLLSIIIVLSNL
jgi:hypothetical protein